MIPTKKDIAFVEYADEASSGTAKDALHNYRLDEEHKIKVCTFTRSRPANPLSDPTPFSPDYLCPQVVLHIMLSVLHIVPVIYE